MSFFLNVPLWLIVIFAAMMLYGLKFSKYGSRYSKPPGPRGLPLIGNLLDIDVSVPSRVPAILRDLNKRYGDILYLDLLGQPTVILGTHETAVEVLDKRSATYSGRQPSVMIQLSGWDWLFSIFPYGARWRRHRKLFLQHFNAKATVAYQALHEREAYRLALRLLEQPDEFLQHVRVTFASMVMSIAYGIEVRGPDDELSRLAGEALSLFNEISVPGKYMVETLPWLRFIPSWFPGAKFKRDSQAWKTIVHRFRDTPWARAVDRIRNGHAVSSMASMHAKEAQMCGFDTKHTTASEDKYDARDVTATAYAGGADTTLSTMQTFFFVMAMYPEAQAKAQAELTAVVGRARLPTSTDQESLPYVRALIKECLRWLPVGPLVLPHFTTESDVFRGYYIPKGTVQTSVRWRMAFSRDSKNYQDADAFVPERFLKDGTHNPDVLDPMAFVFGYGRRICPGIPLAEASLFALISTILHTFTISAPLDAETGVPVKLECKVTGSTITHLEPFSVDIKPRGTWAESLIRQRCDLDAAE
ncbi:cytochrome P450 [Trametes polyzona]|nr:cytochrome P450 [Trametes polyzona]